MVYPEVAKLPRQFKFADKMKMKATLVLGPDEDAKGQVVVKNLSSGEQVTVARESLAETIRRIIGR
jgi:histidyl-tRNA synthetase